MPQQAPQPPAPFQTSFGEFRGDQNFAPPAPQAPVTEVPRRTELPERFEAFGEVAQNLVSQQPQRFEQFQSFQQPQRFEPPQRVEQPERFEQPQRFEQPRMLQMPKRLEPPQQIIQRFQQSQPDFPPNNQPPLQQFPAVQAAEQPRGLGESRFFEDFTLGSFPQSFPRMGELRGNTLQQDPRCPMASPLERFFL